MGFIQDAMKVFKKRELPFSKCNKESDDVYTFLFENPDGITWKAGQHGLFKIIHKKIKNPIRPFTVAAAPAEGVIKITTKINESPSDFKKAMLELKQGMNIGISGPVGSFYHQVDSPSLFIAGGIGITPFRSIIKQIEAEGNDVKNPIHLLYLDSEGSFIFKDELDGIADQTSITMTCLSSRDDLHDEINKFIHLYGNNGKYFIAGPKSMAEAITSYLKENNIAKKNIKKDAFFGY